MEEKKIIEVYTSPTCHYCTELKAYLNEREISFTEYDVTVDKEKREELTKRSGQLGVPVVFVGDEMIIGFDREKLAAVLGIEK